LTKHLISLFFKIMQPYKIVNYSENKGKANNFAKYL